MRDVRDWRDGLMWFLWLAGRFCFSRSSNQTNQINQTNVREQTDCFSILGRTNRRRAKNKTVNSYGFVMEWTGTGQNRQPYQRD